jgi:hypothetical protein
VSAAPSPTRSALVLLGVLIVALVGVPGLWRTRAPEGVIRGVVVDGRGFGIADAAVFLFSEEDLQLIEETRTDAEGDFDFQLTAERPRVLVRPPQASELLSSWGPSAEEAGGTLAFVLRPARPVDVTVRDEAGRPVVGAEVRVYEHRLEAAVVSLAETDVRGRATVTAPAQADLAVFAPGAPRLARWRFDVSIPEAGAELTFSLPAARTVRGHVTDGSQPLEGIVVVAWEEGIEGGWNGCATSDRDGRFELPFTAGPLVVRALDPGLTFLPAKLRLATEPEEPLELALARGSAQVVRTARAGLPLVARVWSWSPEAEAWGWGARTTSSGRATLPVSARFAIHADPLDPAYAPLEAWDVPFEGSTLRLEATPAR